MDVSVIVPVYNEESTLHTIFKRIKNTSIPCEIIFVDDGSTDKTPQIIKDLSQDPTVKVITFPNNRGKGAAVSAGIKISSGDVILLQDADLEYHPEEYTNLLKPIRSGKVCVVFGARFVENNIGSSYFLHFIANKLLTLVTNLLFNSHLNDMETGYKIFPREIFEKLDIQANGFDFEPEITAKLLKKNIEIYEVPINFEPRNYAQGKKIKFKDAVIAFWTLLRIRFTNEE